MHLNDDAVNMLVAACSGGAGAELIDPMSPANYCSDFRTPDNYDYTPNFVSTPLGPMKAVWFTVQASNDAHVAFFDHDLNDAAWSGTGHEHYEVVVSGWGNTQSVLRGLRKVQTTMSPTRPGFCQAKSRVHSGHLP